MGGGRRWERKANGQRAQRPTGLGLAMGMGRALGRQWDDPRVPTGGTAGRPGTEKVRGGGGQVAQEDEETPGSLAAEFAMAGRRSGALDGELWGGRALGICGGRACGAGRGVSLGAVKSGGLRELWWWGAAGRRGGPGIAE